jgi:hypothetical protein
VFLDFAAFDRPMVPQSDRSMDEIVALIEQDIDLFCDRDFETAKKRKLSVPRRFF